MRAAPRITTSSGLTFGPGVSSSKNRSNPALAAGIGALLSRLFSRLPLLMMTFSVLGYML